VGCGAVPNRNMGADQAVPGRACRTVTKATSLVVVLWLAGCASNQSAINPVSWWHGLEGGPIAQKRLSVPGATAPYPNLANVPVLPPLPGAAERAQISAALLADRTHAHQEAVLEPLPGGPAADTPPGAFAAPPPPAHPAAAPAGAASATLPAVTSPAEPQAPTAPAPPAPSPAAAGPATPAALEAAAAAMPRLPMTPPAAPAFAGIGQPGAPPAPFSVALGRGLRLAFAPGSGALSPADRARLGLLAGRRDSAEVAVIGFGDAAASDISAQSAGLELGLARASAVADALVAAGVPEKAIRLEAEASGMGAVVRLVHRGERPSG